MKLCNLELTLSNPSDQEIFITSQQPDNFSQVFVTRISHHYYKIFISCCVTESINHDWRRTKKSGHWHDPGCHRCTKRWNMKSMKLVILHEKRLQTMLWHQNSRVNSHQRWKQTRFLICFHLWCELTTTLTVTEWQVSSNSWKVLN